MTETLNIEEFDGTVDTVETDGMTEETVETNSMTEETVETDVQAQPISQTEPETVFEAEASEESISAETNVKELLAEIERLHGLLDEKEREQTRILSELGDFNRLFPDIAIKNVPKAVWQQVERGIPLCAAYALYEKQEALMSFRAKETNEKNARTSAGVAGKDTAGEYFSPEEVRAMSQKEVHENYSKIKNSMKYWH